MTPVGQARRPTASARPGAFLHVSPPPPSLLFPHSIDAAWATLQSKNAAPLSCDDQLQCAKQLAPGLMEGGVDWTRLYKCDKDAVAERISQDLVCTGARPTAAEIAANYQEFGDDQEPD